jgi:hypothetical protein
MKTEWRLVAMVFFSLCVGCQSVAPTDTSLGGAVELNTPEHNPKVEPTLDGTGAAPLRDEGGESDGDGLVIYLADVSSSELTQTELSALECSGVSIISAVDIVAYSWETHELHLTASANGRLARLQSVIMEKCGLPFVVCVGNETIYGGALWTSYSSAIFKGIVIDVYPAEQNKPVRIQLGYPPGMFEDMQDPRASPMIFKALERAGKLQSR